MWWRDNFKNWIGAIGTIITIGFLVALSVGIELEPYAIWLLMTIVIFLFMPIFIWVPYRLWNQAAPFIVKEQRVHPSRYAFPYLDSINASFIKGGETCLELTIFVPSALLFDLALVKVRGTVIIDGTPTDEEELSPVTIWKQTISTIPFGAHLSNKLCTKIKESINQQKPVDIHVRLNAWDNDNTRYSLDVANKTYRLS